MTESTAIVPGRQIEIYRQEKPSFRSVRVALHENGDVAIDSQDMGQAVEAFFGDSDYERWTIVPAREVGRLAVALLLDKYRGNAVAVDELAGLCEAHGIAAERGSF